MKISEFLADRLGRLLTHFVSMAALAAFLRFTGTGGGVVAVILCFWALGLFLSLAVRYARDRARLLELEAVMDGLDQKQLFLECAPRPKAAYERRLFDLMRRSGKAMIESVSDARAAQRDYRAYIEDWVHEIKGPITAARLIGQSADAETRRKLLPQLAQIDAHVERALFYARAESPERDFIIRQVALAGLVAEAVERNRVLLIQNGVRVETENLDHTVYTDDKWAVFMLGQLLQNAVRYRGEEPVITIFAREESGRLRLAIRDNGIGIPAHELPRIFDRGFTGSNGRARGGATGMGLHICRRLADFLEVSMDAASQEGEWTELGMSFPVRAHENLAKM